MKKNLVMVFVLFICVPFLSGKIKDECKSELEAFFTEGKFLVLKIDGIPTMLQKMPGNLGSKTFCEVKVGTDGEWKLKSILGDASDSSNVLSKGDILVLTSIDFNKESFEIRTRTDKALAYNVRGRTTLMGSTKSSGTGIHANKFFFKIDPDWDCADIKTAVEKYFTVYSTREEITQAKEIKIGMTIKEVAGVLGEPLKKADMGEGKLIYKYEDTIVTFKEGKVINIEFK